MKHVIVTGGSRGIGLGIVARLAQDGYRVTTCSRSSSPQLDALLTKHRDRLQWQPFRIGEDDADQFVLRAAEWAGADGLYAVVNNAGVAVEGTLATFPKPELEKLLDVNLLGALTMSRAVLRVMLTSQTAGRIINLSSIAALHGATGLVAYCATKAGMDGMTRALAREVGRRGITVNSVAPGYVATEMSSTLSPEQRQRIVRRTPLGRMATVEDIGAAVAFLLSDDAAFISGQTLVVDGGMSC